LHARHLWLLDKRAELTSRLQADPDYHDPKIAGWWLWGIACWIGSGWCAGGGPWQNVDGLFLKPGNNGQGVNRQMPHLGNAGQGVNRQNQPLVEYFTALANRLRNVRVCCGEWDRILGPTPTTSFGVTAVFLDPPYSAEANRNMDLYAEESGTVAHDVRAWCKANGGNPKLRIALCGYEGEGHDALTEQGWTAVPWKASGGYGSQGSKPNINATREVIWFSPHCLQPEAELNLFSIE
jgi:DNA adenine methylase